MNRPSFQFYPQDWRDDPLLQMCSLEARGLWIELMSLMHKAEPYGHLQFNGKDVDLKTLSLLVRADIDVTERALNELEEHAVFSKNKDGIIYCRRMVRDERNRGGTRKRLKKHRDKEKIETLVKRKRNGDETAMKRLSSSSSSSSTSKKEKEEEKSALRSQRAVYWDPKPRWSKDHPSLKDAVLHVRPEHLAGLERDFPRVEGNGHDGGGVKAQILRLKRYAITNPSWAKQRKDWVKTLAKWLNNADQYFDDARFKAGQSPANAYTAWEEEAFDSPASEEDKARQRGKIEACEKEHDQHRDGELKPGSNFAFCRHECGYHRPLERGQ